MGAFIDLTGKQFGRLTAIEKVEKRGTEWYWRCKCECGGERIVAGKNLRGGQCRSCGCLKKESDNAPNTKNVINMLGKTFGHLTVIARDGSDHRGEAKWLCQCDCGYSQPISVLGSNLRTGHTTSCGCDRRSKGEQKIANILLKNQIKFITEYRLKDIYQYRFDFYIPDWNCLIEYDGETHFDLSLHGWHTEEQLAKTLERDELKNKYCLEHNIPLIRIPFTHYMDINLQDLNPETSKFLLKKGQ